MYHHLTTKEKNTLNNKINLKQSHSVSLTPKLKEFLNILNLSNPDLIDYIKNETEQNPFIDYKENTIEDIDNKYIYRKEDQKNFQNNTEQISNKEKSLYEHITEQVNIYITNPDELLIAYNFINRIDKNGYIEEEAVKNISEKFKYKEEIVKKVLDKLQSFDPAGIFARNLNECLKLQLQEKKLYNPVMEKLLKHLALLAKYRIEDLQKICRTSKENIIKMYKEIKKLNPKPGSIFLQTQENITNADVILLKDSKNNFQIIANEKILPDITVNREYYSRMLSNLKTEKEKIFLSEKINTASWLRRSLHKRINTIINVSKEIISRQKLFFIYNDINYIKPMILSDIATTLNINQSTVSRAVNGKFLSSDIGVFELKFFFSTGVKTSYIKDKISNKTAQHAIKEIIDNETASNILSDEDIVKILQDQGINIARRTVTKYRKIYNIPPSSVRKRMYITTT